jgi:hypothetical protein
LATSVLQKYINFIILFNLFLGVLCPMGTYMPDSGRLKCSACPLQSTTNGAVIFLIKEFLFRKKSYV